MSDGRWQLLLHLQGSTSVGFSYISFVLLRVPFAIFFKCILCPYALQIPSHIFKFFSRKSSKAKQTCLSENQKSGHLPLKVSESRPAGFSLAPLMVKRVKFLYLTYLSVKACLQTRTEKLKLFPHSVSHCGFV